jgi:hypothetical protein
MGNAFEKPQRKRPHGRLGMYKEFINWVYKTKV